MKQKNLPRKLIIFTKLIPFELITLSFKPYVVDYSTLSGHFFVWHYSETGGFSSLVREGLRTQEKKHSWCMPTRWRRQLRCNSATSVDSWWTIRLTGGQNAIRDRTLAWIAIDSGVFNFISSIQFQWKCIF